MDILLIFSSYSASVRVFMVKGGFRYYEVKEYNFNSAHDVLLDCIQ
jgi:hypothetical protein